MFFGKCKSCVKSRCKPCDLKRVNLQAKQPACLHSELLYPAAQLVEPADCNAGWTKGRFWIRVSEARHGRTITNLKLFREWRKSRCRCSVATEQPRKRTAFMSFSAVSIKGFNGGGAPRGVREEEASVTSRGFFARGPLCPCIGNDCSCTHYG